MSANIIKFYFIYLCTTYICTKLTNHKFTSVLQIIFSYTYPLVLAGIAYFLKLHLIELTYIIPLLVIWFFISLHNAQPQKSFVATIISFGISYSLYAISGTLALLIMSPIHYKNPPFPYPILATLTSAILLLFTIGLFRLKRFRKGMPFLFSTTFVNVATGICLFLIAFLTYIPSKFSNMWAYVLALFVSIVVLATLIFWWQAQLTKSYKRALQLRELESLRLELQEKDKLITSLTDQNERLGKLIHRDNKLIPAMNHAVCEYLVSHASASQTVKEKGDSLLVELRHLSENRTNIIAEIYANKCRQHATGVPALDTLLNYMEKRANQEGVHLSIHVALELSDYIPRIITSSDLVHLLSDLLENAFIATNHCMTRNVQLQFYQSQKAFIIEIADNGIPFEAISLINLGITKMTTHSDTGGSGIGLMDIWEIKEKYGASLHITEYETTTPYSKKIAFIFNGKNRYSVSTWRKDDLLQASKRADLQVYTHEND